MFSIIVSIAVVLAVVVPPIALTRAVYKHFRYRRGLSGFIRQVMAIALSLLPLVANLTYLHSAAPALRTGEFAPDRMFALALVISWAAVWGRMAVRRLRKRRLLIH